ncbi:hypothetical protein XA68_17396 [Ophiocordyceps unilateralis]|uniref:Protein phosphatase n=1 Tax=Ophiocordyceps unilateralis TaxID=268505 RepID=A0A2A9P4L3_OPHUN|nr:hypothetical protein XA68_17396 [Ophiocordyceps unilateralis]
MATGLSLRVAIRGIPSGHFAGGRRCFSTAVPLAPSFGFYLAASFSAKGQFFDPSTHVFHFDGRRSRGRPASGHDAFFVSRVSGSDAVAFGVADGVGGWVDSGVDPADFSHGLCNFMADAAACSDSRPLTARKLMAAGYDALCRDGSVRAGGSTACVAIASPDGIMDLANLGDSGFLQLRLNAVNAVSGPQTHAFNAPYQLSVIPPRMAAQAAALGGSAPFRDLPRDADVSQHRLRHGDVLLLATDGLLDNLFHQDILHIASRVMVSSGAWTLTQTEGVRVSESIDALVATTEGKTLQSLLATELVAAAKAASVNVKIDGPFAKEAKRYYPNERWNGGKVDDICVVVAVVCEHSVRVKSSL